MPPLNLERRRIIIEGYAAGTPLLEIARQAGTTYEGVRTTASRLKLKSARRAALDAQREAESAAHSPQYLAWLRARDGAKKTLQGLSK